MLMSLKDEIKAVRALRAQGLSVAAIRARFHHKSIGWVQARYDPKYMSRKGLYLYRELLREEEAAKKELGNEIDNVFKKMEERCK